MSNRTDLAALLRTELPIARFDVKDTADLPDAIAKATVVLRMGEFVPAPNARGSWWATFHVIVASHHKDRTRAEDAIEEDLPTVCEALDKKAGLMIRRATPVMVKDAYFGFEIEAVFPMPAPY